jgi:hypothetical protein
LTKRDLTLASVAGGIVLLAVVVFVFRSGSDVAITDRATVYGVDLATGDPDIQLEVPIGQGVTPPYENPQTGERTVYPWFFDDETGRRFVPPLQPQPDGPPTLPIMITSPDGNAGEPWFPGLAEDLQVERGEDYPLPELPN